MSRRSHIASPGFQVSVTRLGLRALIRARIRCELRRFIRCSPDPSLGLVSSCCTWSEGRSAAHLSCPGAASAAKGNDGEGLGHRSKPGRLPSEPGFRSRSRESAAAALLRLQLTRSAEADLVGAALSGASQHPKAPRRTRRTAKSSSLSRAPKCSLRAEGLDGDSSMPRPKAIHGGPFTRAPRHHRSGGSCSGRLDKENRLGALPLGARRLVAAEPSPPKWRRLPMISHCRGPIRGSDQPPREVARRASTRCEGYRWAPKSAGGPQRGSSRNGVVHVKELSEECVPA